MENPQNLTEKVAGCPHGVPDDLYHLPQLNGCGHI